MARELIRVNQSLPEQPTTTNNNETQTEEIELQPLPAPEIITPDVIEQLKLPPTNIFGNNLKEIKSFRDIRHEIKNNIKIQKFKDEVSNVLKYFNVHKLKYNHDVVKFVCQIAEDFFLEKHSGQTKLKCVIEVCKMLYGNNEDLTQSIIEMVLPAIIHMNRFRKIKIQIRNFFSSVIYRQKK